MIAAIGHFAAFESSQHRAPSKGHYNIFSIKETNGQWVAYWKGTKLLAAKANTKGELLDALDDL